MMDLGNYKIFVFGNRFRGILGKRVCEEQKYGRDGESVSEYEQRILFGFLWSKSKYW